MTAFRVRVYLATLFFISVIFAETHFASAQTSNTSGTYADGHNPVGPPDPAKEAQIWNVDTLTGAVSIKIPFLTVAPAGRGAFYPYSLEYNSSATYTLSSSMIGDPTGVTPGLTMFQWFGPLTNDPGDPPDHT